MVKKILVIDDDPAVRKSFKLALEDTKYQVDAAESGEEGLKIFKAKKYDLIYLDLKMPGMNGVETLSEIRKLNKNIPVYIVTAFHEEFFSLLNSVAKDGINFELLRKPLGDEQIKEITGGILNG